MGGRYPYPQHVMLPPGLRYLLRCCLVSLRYVCYLKKNCFKNIEIDSFLRPFPRFPVNFLESVKKSEFQISFGASNLNEEQRSIILQTKYFPRRLLIHRYVEFSQNVGWKNDGDHFTQNEESGIRNFLSIWFFRGNNGLK